MEILKLVKQVQYYVIFMLASIFLLFFDPSCLPYEIGRFSDNILSEVAGVMLEITIIIVMFKRIEAKKEKDGINSEAQKAKDEINKIERRLREYIAFFLKDNFKDFKAESLFEEFSARDYERTIRNLNDLIRKLEDEHLSESITLKLQYYCKSEKEIFNNLIPVASGLTNDHFKAWVRITYFMNEIASKNGKINANTVKLIKKIKLFEEASYAQGVGS